MMRITEPNWHARVSHVAFDVSNGKDISQQTIFWFNKAHTHTNTYPRRPCFFLWTKQLPYSRTCSAGQLVFLASYLGKIKKLIASLEMSNCRHIVWHTQVLPHFNVALDEAVVYGLEDFVVVFGPEIIGLDNTPVEMLFGKVGRLLATVSIEYGKIGEQYVRLVVVLVLTLESYLVTVFHVFAVALACIGRHAHIYAVIVASIRHFVKVLLIMNGHSIDKQTHASRYPLLVEYEFLGTCRNPKSKKADNQDLEWRNNNNNRNKLTTSVYSFQSIYMPVCVCFCIHTHIQCNNICNCVCVKRIFFFFDLSLSL